MTLKDRGAGIRASLWRDFPRNGKRRCDGTPCERRRLILQGANRSSRRYKQLSDVPKGSPKYAANVTLNSADELGLRDFGCPPLPAKGQNRDTASSSHDPFLFRRGSAGIRQWIAVSLAQQQEVGGSVFNPPKASLAGRHGLRRVVFETPGLVSQRPDQSGESITLILKASSNRADKNLHCAASYK